MAPQHTPHPAPLDGLYELAHAHDLIAQRPVIDALLDLYGESADGVARPEITAALQRYGKRSLITAAELLETVALIGGAREVDHAFDHLLLAS